MPTPSDSAPDGAAPRPVKRRGRKLATGPFATRAELCEKMRWYYEHTSMSIEAIGHRFGISQGTARKALDEALGTAPTQA